MPIATPARHFPFRGILLISISILGWIGLETVREPFSLWRLDVPEAVSHFVIV
jgi:hypothetical protein